MKINVEVLNDIACQSCPEFEIDFINHYGNDEVIYRYFRCANLDTCREAIRRSTVKKEGHNE